ncbi:hypothetical protein EYF80_005029 [Liparis tanakae]|uniref:Uncharacterized protein n=1 Tax=Liparis tanakae TaxID=230148 RepID=A0A4Z2J407_9TELE|nr:hypothetical protein EYF80_005029 [Liparis tanakae]
MWTTQSQCELLRVRPPQTKRSLRNVYISDARKNETESITPEGEGDDPSSYPLITSEESILMGTTSG